MLTIEPLSLGVGDRFGHQAQAQLQACLLAAGQGVEVIPVWNKSNREHLTIGSEPGAVRAAADAAVQALRWRRPYHVDADHIGLATMERFLPHADFFTIDVADFIGQPPEPGAAEAFAARHSELAGNVAVRGIDRPLELKPDDVKRIASHYLRAASEAGRIYRRLVEAKGEGGFVTEVSMDETAAPQTPPELLVILAALADAGIPVQTIAPKFTGRFNKGVDYAGDAVQFEREFNDDVCVIAHAVKQYGLPASLKLSVHSGSDKFSIYPAMARAVARHGCGLHLKTAGTTWLEEVIGLAEAGGEGLEMAKAIYREARAHKDELCAPYAAVIDIDPGKLPDAAEVEAWEAARFVRALRHEPGHPEFNPHLRQLLHVGYKVAAKMGERYLRLLEANADVVARNVTRNLFERHIQPLFLGGAPRMG